MNTLLGGDVCLEGAQRVSNLCYGYMAIDHFQMASEGGHSAEALICTTSVSCI